MEPHPNQVSRTTTTNNNQTPPILSCPTRKIIATRGRRKGVIKVEPLIVEDIQIKIENPLKNKTRPLDHTNIPFNALKNVVDDQVWGQIAHQEIFGEDIKSLIPQNPLTPKILYIEMTILQQKYVETISKSNQSQQIFLLHNYIEQINADQSQEVGNACKIVHVRQIDEQDSCSRFIFLIGFEQEKIVEVVDLKCYNELDGEESQSSFLLEAVNEFVQRLEPFHADWITNKERCIISSYCNHFQEVHDFDAVNSGVAVLMLLEQMTGRKPTKKRRIEPNRFDLYRARYCRDILNVVQPVISRTNIQSPPPLSPLTFSPPPPEQQNEQLHGFEIIYEPHQEQPEELLWGKIAFAENFFYNLTLGDAESLKFTSALTDNVVNACLLMEENTAESSFSYIPSEITERIVGWEGLIPSYASFIQEKILKRPIVVFGTKCSVEPPPPPSEEPTANNHWIIIIAQIHNQTIQIFDPCLKGSDTVQVGQLTHYHERKSNKFFILRCIRRALAYCFNDEDERVWSHCGWGNWPLFVPHEDANLPVSLHMKDSGLFCVAYVHQWNSGLPFIAPDIYALYDEGDEIGRNFASITIRKRIFTEFVQQFNPILKEVFIFQGMMGKCPYCIDGHLLNFDQMKVHFTVTHANCALF